MNFFYRVTINKNSDYENSTDTLKRISGPEKPNNQTKGVGGATLPPHQMKCNILKARADEEAHTPTKLTNQLFVSSSNATNSDSGPDSLNAATFVSVVRKFFYWNLYNFVLFM